MSKTLGPIPTYDEAAPDLDTDNAASRLAAEKDISYMEALLIVRDRNEDINAAADFINDATRDLQPDVFAAVLQAAIARRD
jgi:hypothetical protein